MNCEYRYDSKGIPYSYPTLYLDAIEYFKIVSEINTNYKLYWNKPFCIHCSVGIDGCYCMYYFENHGYNDYNIVDRFKY